MSNATDAVETLYKRLIDAWNRRDARGMADLYADGGWQIGFDGSTLHGREDIRQHLEPIFRDHPTAKFVTIIREAREIDGKAAILAAVAGMIPPGQNSIDPEKNAVQILTASRGESGQWLVEVFQNTPAAFHGRDDERAKLTDELQAAKLKR